MDQELVREYRKHRKFYHTGEQALRAARVNAAFERAEQAGLVRVKAEPEWELYDDSYIDTWEISEGRKERAKKELWARIERDGVWIYCTQFVNAEGHWETADSVGSFIGSDWQNSGYDVDMKLSALTALGLAEIFNNLPRTF